MLVSKFVISSCSGPCSGSRDEVDTVKSRELLQISDEMDGEVHTENANRKSEVKPLEKTTLNSSICCRKSTYLKFST